MSTMKIQYMSDIHLECSNFNVQKNGDVLVLAGDVFNGGTVQRFKDFMDRTMDLGYDAVFYVLGNHEGYGWSIPKARSLLYEMDSRIADFWYLDRSGAVINGQRFIGASLWSNPDQNAAIHARLYINDYRAIAGWTIDDHVREHKKDLEYLQHAVKENDVVITHFPPTYNGVDQKRFGGDVLNYWFVNKLEGFITRTKPQLWISGHTHYCWDKQVGVTRDVGNCRGYTFIHKSTGQWTSEIKGFDPTKAITIEISDNSSDGAAS